ncbi:hypothetical protein SLS62_003359 [Diatrype stigma]|uniref:HMG box domain-containing protein n=1 Tax=Diatrype stigma TaxID=117547 RepID=A0AAN9UW48_9PEZI
MNALLDVKADHGSIGDIAGHWNVLSIQVSQFNRIISIPSVWYESWTPIERVTIQTLMTGIVEEKVNYATPSGVRDRVYLGTHAEFAKAGIMLYSVPDQEPSMMLPEDPQVPKNDAANTATLGNKPEAGTPFNHSGKASSPKEKKRSKEPASGIRRSRNAFLVYRNAVEAALMIEMPELSFIQRSKELGRRWKRLSGAQQAPFRRQAAEEKRLHKIAHPNYKYEPRNPSEIKRRNGKKDAQAAETPATTAVPDAAPVATPAASPVSSSVAGLEVDPEYDGHENQFSFNHINGNHGAGAAAPVAAPDIDDADIELLLKFIHEGDGAGVTAPVATSENNGNENHFSFDLNNRDNGAGAAAPVVAPNHGLENQLFLNPSNRNSGEFNLDQNTVDHTGGIDYWGVGDGYGY